MGVKSRINVFTENEYPKLMVHIKEKEVIFISSMPGQVTVVAAPQGSSWKVGVHHINFNMQYLEDFKGTVELYS